MIINEFKRFLLRNIDSQSNFSVTQNQFMTHFSWNYFDPFKVFGRGTFGALLKVTQLLFQNKVISSDFIRFRKSNCSCIIQTSYIVIASNVHNSFILNAVNCWKDSSHEIYNPKYVSLLFTRMQHFPLVHWSIEPLIRVWHFRH